MLARLTSLHTIFLEMNNTCIRICSTQNYVCMLDVCGFIHIRSEVTFLTIDCRTDTELVMSCPTSIIEATGCAHEKLLHRVLKEIWFMNTLLYQA